MHWQGGSGGDAKAVRGRSKCRRASLFFKTESIYFTDQLVIGVRRAVAGTRSMCKDRQRMILVKLLLQMAVLSFPSCRDSILCRNCFTDGISSGYEVTQGTGSYHFGVRARWINDNGLRYTTCDAPVLKLSGGHHKCTGTCFWKANLLRHSLIHPFSVISTTALRVARNNLNGLFKISKGGAGSLTTAKQRRRTKGLNQFYTGGIEHLEEQVGSMLEAYTCLVALKM